MIEKTMKPCKVFFLAITSLWLVLTGTGYAEPAAPFLHSLTQPDGTVFHARQWGDESLHGWQTEGGHTILFDKTLDSWTYATRDKDGRLVCSSCVVGRDPLPGGHALHLRPEDRHRLERVQRMTSKEKAAKEFFQKGSRENAASQKLVATVGVANLPVILVNFRDTKTKYQKADFNTLLFGSGNYSMKDYYEEVSYGKFSVSGGPAGILGWYTAQETHDYYGQNDNSDEDRWPGDLVYEAVASADADVDFSAYDGDGDGYVDVVNIVHQGDSESSSGLASDVWSHRWSLDSAMRSGYSHHGVYTTNDKNATGVFVKIDDYTMVSEKSSDGTIATVGTFVHEYGHALGLPDLYDTDYSSEGIGSWSLMAGGSWNYVTKDGDRPAHLDPWCKYYLGWTTPTEVMGTLENAPITQAETTSSAYKLLNGTPMAGEYFLVENRQKIGFDAGLPGDGLLIWHIDGFAIANRYDANEVNDSECHPPDICPVNHYGVTLVQADGLWDLERNKDSGDTGDPYPGAVRNTSFTGSSSPQSNLHNGGKSGVSVTGISASGGTMTVTLSVESSGVCEAETVEASPAKLKLKKGATGTVTITVLGAGNCPVEGAVVTARLTASARKYFSRKPKNGSTDADGKITFEVTARNASGKGGIVIETGGMEKSITVRVAN